MARITAVGAWRLAVLFLGSGLLVQAQKPQPLSSFVIDATRPYVYLKFDHLGQGVPLNENEPSQRLWFRLVNNSKVPIVIDTFGVPEGSPKDECGVMDKVVRNEVGGDGAVTVLPPMRSSSPLGSSEKPAVDQKPEGMPYGYWFHVGSTMSIPPGEAVLFSLPTSHLSTGWHVQIPFTFEVPHGRGPRDPAVGGEPEMFLSYFLADLPDEVRSKIQKR